MTDAPTPSHWTNYTPQEAKALGLDLSKHLEIGAPLNEQFERCPWPWDPEQLTGAPIGQYHCPYCGAMVMAGIQHLDYTPGVPAGWENWEPVPVRLTVRDLAWFAVRLRIGYDHRNWSNVLSVVEDLAESAFLTHANAEPQPYVTLQPPPAGEYKEQGAGETAL